jgi:hypothetical protein
MPKKTIPRLINKLCSWLVVNRLVGSSAPVTGTSSGGWLPLCMVGGGGKVDSGEVGVFGDTGVSAISGVTGVVVGVKVGVEVAVAVDVSVGVYVGV